MSLTVTIDYAGNSMAALADIGASCRDLVGLNKRLAGAAESLVKTKGAEISEREENHRTANALGATPTGNLERAFAAIESSSNSGGASLFIPAASRLRAAFGSYVLTPVNGAKFLTIPMAAEAYGHRAREFGDLFAVRFHTGNLCLCRKNPDGTLRLMYALLAQATIREERSLFPFEELEGEMTDQAEAFYEEIIERNQKA